MPPSWIQKLSIMTGQPGNIEAWAATSGTERRPPGAAGPPEGGRAAPPSRRRPRRRRCPKTPSQVVPDDLVRPQVVPRSDQPGPAHRGEEWRGGRRGDPAKGWPLQVESGVARRMRTRRRRSSPSRASARPSACARARAAGRGRPGCPARTRRRRSRRRRAAEPASSSCGGPRNQSSGASQTWVNVTEDSAGRHPADEPEVLLRLERPAAERLRLTVGHQRPRGDRPARSRREDASVGGAGRPRRR